MSTNSTNTGGSPASPLSFEQSIARLEQIIARIDHPETGLEETIALTAEGNRLIRKSRQLLEQAELKIRTLSEPESPESAEPSSATEFPEQSPTPTSKNNKTATNGKTAASPADDHGFSLF